MDFLSFLLVETSHPTPYLLVALIGGYLSGSVPYGLILTKLAGAGDIRDVGSGNIGATNVLRAAGKKIAAITLLLDALKGAVPVLAAGNVSLDYAILAGLAAFFGHLFPVWLKFKGGKGVATALGICFAFSLPLGGIMCGLWLIVAGATQYSSAAGLAIFGFAPMIALYLTQKLEITLAILIMSTAVWIRHRANIKRLINNTESKIDLDKKSNDAAPVEQPSEEKAAK